MLPDQDPAFRALEHRVAGAAAEATAHQPGRHAAATAQGASRPDPQRDVASQAAADQVDVMAAQEPAPFDAARFKAAIHARIEALAPPATLGEAEQFKNSGAAAGATADVHGLVLEGRTTAEQGIGAATATEPDPTGRKPKAVTGMVNDSLGARLPDPDAGAALPGPKPPEELDLLKGTQTIDARMARAGVTDSQLADSGEPRFQTALDAHEQARGDAVSAPAAYRLEERLRLARGRAEADSAAATALGEMRGSRLHAVGQALGVKERTKLEDQRRREDVSNQLIAIHRDTQRDVEGILKTLAKTVEGMFTEGEAGARAIFEGYVDVKMREYKDERYGSLGGGALWLKDEIAGLPSEVDAFYRRGRDFYMMFMDRLLDRIATTVGFHLGLAHLRILLGRGQVHAFVRNLPAELQTLGAQTAGALDARFEQLAADVDAKRDELIDTIAHRYVDANTALDVRIKELQDANKGLVSRAIDAIEGVIRTIAQLGKLLLRVLLKAASVIGDVLAHPIRFLGNLIGAVSGGLGRFVDHIGGHVKDALLDLLFGTVGNAIRLPTNLDAEGVLDLVLQMLGVTWDHVRERLVTRFGAPLVRRMEQDAEIISTLARTGLAAAWTWIRDRLGDLYEMVIGRIESFIVERVVRAGVGFVLTLLTPASAFIKACQTIIQIVSFIVEKASQLAEFIDSVLDSIAAIAAGDTSAAEERIEAALARGLTLAIGFLAKLANVGAIGETVRKIVDAVRRPVTAAIDAVVFAAAESYRRGRGPALASAARAPAPARAAVAPAPRAPPHPAPRTAPPVPSRARAGGRAPTAARAPPAPRALPAPAATPVSDHAVTPLETEPAPLDVHRRFTSEGREHQLYGGPDGAQLIVASHGPTPVRDIPDASGRLAELADKYEGALGRYHAALSALEADPHARTGWTVIRREINTTIGKIIKRIRELQIDDAPGASAPGIGMKGRHGQQTTRLRVGPRLWWLESEHVMPFAIGKQLWDTIGELIPGRGGAEDLRQTTIMLYEEAAESKTRDHDVAAISAFKAQYADALQEAAKRLRRFRESEGRFGGESEADRQFRDVFAKAISAMWSAASSATRETRRAVQAEHALLANGQTHGARRAEAQPLPPDGDIEAAASQQYDDVLELAHRSVAPRRRRP